MIRYQDPNSTDPNGNEPSAGSNPVTTIWHYDSLGQVTELDEPGTAPEFGLYDSWGELTKAQWCDPTISSCVVAGTINRAMISRYDALGRLVHGEDQTANQTVLETVVDYSYDQPVDTTTPPVRAANVLGAWPRPHRRRVRSCTAMTIWAGPTPACSPTAR